MGMGARCRFCRQSPYPIAGDYLLRDHCESEPAGGLAFGWSELSSGFEFDQRRRGCLARAGRVRGADERLLWSRTRPTGLVVSTQADGARRGRCELVLSAAAAGPDQVVLAIASSCRTRGRTPRRRPVADIHWVASMSCEKPPAAAARIRGASDGLMWEYGNWAELATATELDWRRLAEAVPPRGSEWGGSCRAAVAEEERTTEKDHEPSEQGLCDAVGQHERGAAGAPRRGTGPAQPTAASPTRPDDGPFALSGLRADSRKNTEFQEPNSESQGEHIFIEDEQPKSTEPTS